MAKDSDKIKDPAELIIKDHFLLKTTEVLKIFRVSRKTLFKLISQSKFPQPKIRMGQMYLWKKEDIQKWIEQ